MQTYIVAKHETCTKKKRVMYCMLWNMLWFSYTECGKGRALGMESGNIKDGQITASSFYTGFNPWEGRLNNNHYWATSAKSPSNPWIQVDLLRSTQVTGITSQGSGNQEWVTAFQVQYGDSEDSLMYIMENGEPKVSLFKCVCHVVVLFRP